MAGRTTSRATESPARPGGATRAEDQSAEISVGRRLLAELIGTFALTCVAAGGDAMARISGGQVEPMARAIAPGLLVMAFIYALGDASGAHFNPAVSLGFAVKRLFPFRWLLLYWAAQIAGACLAALALRQILGDALTAGVTEPHVPAGDALWIEALLSWLLLTVILGTADRYRLVGPNAALAVGATIALCGLIALPIEGASMNPARSLGPAIVTGRLSDVWIYVLGPVLGALAAVAVTRILHGAEPKDPKQVEAARGKPATDA